jgi:uncharacterized protein YdaU (DUF1376 family)
MKPDAWMPFYIADYLRDTMRLTRDQHGAYFLLLMACWVEGGKLPNDPGELAAIAKATPAEWKRLAPKILPYFKSDGEFLTHTRVTSEVEKAARLSETRRNAGRQGGRPPLETESKPKANANQTALQNETPTRVARPSPSPLPSEVEAAAVAREDDWPPGGMEAWRPALHAIAGPGLGDPAKEPGLFTTAGELVRWRQAGCSWELDVLPVIQGKTQRVRGSPIRTWPLFTEAIMAAKARRLSPLTEPEIQHGQGGYSERRGGPSAAEVNLAAAARAVAKRRGGDSGAEAGPDGPAVLALPGSRG